MTASLVSTAPDVVRGLIQVHWEGWIKQGWSLETLAKWRTEFQRRLNRTPSHWDLQFAQLHVDVLNDLLADYDADLIQKL